MVNSNWTWAKQIVVHTANNLDQMSRWMIDNDMAEEAKDIDTARDKLRLRAIGMSSHPAYPDPLLS